MQSPQTKNPLWLLLQLADGTFPSGGFAHSGGLEASMVLGALDLTNPVGGFLDASLEQVGSTTLPFVREAVLHPSSLVIVDEAYDCTLPMLAPNRASRALGRALIGAASRVWTDAVADVNAYAKANTHPVHHACIFGAIFGSLGVAMNDALTAYLHGAARSVLSAAVRLGLSGPLEAQAMIADRATLLDSILERSLTIDTRDTAQTAPLIEMYAALHDRLDGRMFQS